MKQSTWIALVAMAATVTLTACSDSDTNGGTSSGQGGGTSTSTTTTSDASSSGTGGQGGGKQEVCGDGALSTDEACDDGNTDAGDGCDDQCALEAGYDCSGEPTVCETICGDGIVLPEEGCDDGNVDAADGCDDTCAVETGYDCSGEPSACATICGDGLILGAEVCDDGNSDAGDGCDDTCAEETGYACDGAEPTVCMEICGDGLVLGVEGCDDGGTALGDGCDDICAVELGYGCTGEPSACAEVCGDALVVGVEGCDDGNLALGDGCDDLCVAEAGYLCSGEPSVCGSVCGDSLIVAMEACDDGNTGPGDGCDAACAIETGYACMGAPSVCGEVCGDGLVVGAEACDDGNTTPGDGCDATCGVESGYACSGAPSACAAICGDGLLVAMEACDDGNTGAGDGCSAACAIETGWTCMGAPSACAAICGDGLILGAEGCDDSNTGAGDGCGAACAIEAGWNCAGQPTMCSTTCGDGIAVGMESCDDGNTVSGDCCSSACQLEAGCEIEPNDSIAIANDFAAIQIANLVKANINTPGDTDYFEIVVPMGSQGNITAETKDGALGTTCTSLVLDSYLRIYDAGGAVLATDEDSGDGYCSLTSVTSLAAGSYFVEALSSPTYGPLDTWDYTVEITTTLQTCGNNVMEGSESCDDGNLVGGDGCSATCQLECINETEPNDAFASSDGPFAAPWLVCGSINPIGDHDWYTFTLSATSDISIETFDGTGVGNCVSADAEVFLYGADGVTLIASDDDDGIGNCSLLNYTTDARVGHLPPGTYYFDVEHYNAGGSATLDYQLQFTLTAVCGDGIVQGAEQCEPGGPFNCGADCSIIPDVGEAYFNPEPIAGSGAITPTSALRLNAPSCFAAGANNIHWYAYTVTQGQVSVAGNAAGAMALVDVNGASKGCTADAQGSPLTTLATVGSQVIIAVETAGPISVLTISELPYTGVGTTLTNMNITGLSVTDYELAVGGSQLFFSSTATIYTAPKTGNAAAVIAQGATVTGTHIGYDIVFANNSLFSIDTTTTTTANRLFKIYDDATTTWGPITWDLTPSYTASSGSDTVTSDGTALIYAGYQSSTTTGAAPFWSVPLAGPAVPTLLGTNPNVFSVTGMAADSLYFYVFGRLQLTDAYGLYRIDRANITGPVTTLYTGTGGSGLHTSVAADNTTAASYVYFRPTSGAPSDVHVVGNASGAAGYLGVISTEGTTSDYAMTYDPFDNSIYLFGTETVTAGAIWKLQ